MPAQAFSNVVASPFTVAIPILRPVKLPGPHTTANKLISSSGVLLSSRALLMSLSKVLECETRGSPVLQASTVAPREMQTLPPRVAVSTLRIKGLAPKVGPLITDKSIVDKSSLATTSLYHADGLGICRLSAKNHRPDTATVEKHQTGPLG